MPTHTLIACLSLLSLMLPSFCLAQDVPYSIGSWPEAGNGNHRAVLEVAQAADAVWAHIEWRRRDLEPETKDIRIVDAQTGERITNVARIQVTRVFGDLAFQPKTVPGKYYVYYLPYNPGVGNFDDPGTYFAPEDTADATWLAAHSLTPDSLAGDQWRELPRAKTLGIEARGEFHRMDPMEVIATPEEVQGLLEAHPGRDYLLFPEDRTHAIRMIDDLPLRWIETGPAERFRGEAQPGEYYALQLGVWAARADIADVALELSDLRSSRGKSAIAADQITCFNLEGTDWLGKPIAKRFSVGRGKVRPLWIGVQIPPDAEGVYRGSVTLRPSGLEPTEVSIRLTVAGEVLADAGDSDLWRLARLRWLNSTRAVDEDVVAPFTPLEVAGSSTRCLGRTVIFGRTGLPSSITSFGNEVLAAPVEFAVDAGKKRVQWKGGGARVTHASAGVVRRQAEVTGDGLSLETASKMEFDGCVSIETTLRAARDVELNDVRLLMPLRKDIARYMMGFSKRGGFRPAEWRWKWDIDRADNMVWLGGVRAGVQLKLCTDVDNWESVDLKGSGLPASWSNDGAGGCDVTEEGDRVLVSAYTGPRRMAAGDQLTFRYRFLVTPFKPLDPRRWDWRVGDPKGEANILHIHHSTGSNPYINYPFIEADQLAGEIKAVRSITTRRAEDGSLTYPAPGNIDPKRGAMHLWVRLLFDPQVVAPQQSIYNQNLIALTWPNGDEAGFYWNIDDHGMRCYIRKGHFTGHHTYPLVIGSNSPDWHEGETHLLTLTWGDSLGIYVDGQRVASAGYKGLLDTDLEGAVLNLGGHGFGIDALKITGEEYQEGAATAPTVDGSTLLLDTFAGWEGGRETAPEKAPGGAGEFDGTIEREPGQFGPEVRLWYTEEPVPPKGANVYYTVRELTNYVAEMWPLRSLGDEVFVTGEHMIYSAEGAIMSQAGGGYPWLKEHLVTGYVPAWRQPLGNGATDAAIATQGLSRWHNYYIEGLDWLMENTGMDGLYLDGIGYDREIMKRVAKVMLRRDPNSRINFHSGNNYAYLDRRVSPANEYMEHFPYISNLWIGEMYDYNLSPDYWLVEISGLPFGLGSEMLNYQTGGNAHRGMVYGMSGRQHPSHTAMWSFWDEFGIQDAEMIGYWDDDCPVRTNRDDVLATVYKKPGATLIALGRWPEERPRRTARTVPAKAAPTIDGTLAEGEWDGAARLSAFTEFDADGPAGEQTEVLVTYDENRLYIASRCDQSAGSPKASVSERDGPVWEDDAIEVFIQPDLAEGRYVQLVGNSASAFADCQGTDTSWNGDWTYRSSVHEGRWEAEVSVSFASLGMASPADGDVIGINVCRDQQTPRAQLSCWAPSSGTFHNVANFGRLAFSETGPPTLDDKAVFPVSTVNVRLKIDWEALGLDPGKTVLSAPGIAQFQDRAEFGASDPIPVEPGKGWLLIMEER